MTFPATPLDLRCELLLGGTYTDVSQYVYQRDGTQPLVVLTRGRADESATANPGSGTWQWNNRDGRFSPKNPVSPFYGMLGRNTPVRWSVPSQVNYLRIETDTASYAQAPDAAPLDITGDTDIRIDFRPSDYRFAALCGKNSGGTGPSWLLERHSDGTLIFFWFDSGSVQHTVQSTAPVPYGRVAIRVTLAVATGTVTYYTAPSISGTWTQLGAAASGTGGAATSVFSGTAPLRVGDNSSAGYGSYYAFELRNGIGGTVVANPDFTAQAPGAASFADAAGNTWTLAGTAEISGRDYRFHGEMSSQPPKWDVTGTDQYVAAAAGGPLRRLTQGQAPPVMSPVKRGYLQLPAPEKLVAYWPGEDAAGASSLGSAVGGPAMYFSGSLQLASGSSFMASSPLPVMNGAVLAGTVPPYTSGTACIFRFLLAEAASSIPNGTVIARMATTGTVAWADLSYDSGGALTLTGYSPSGAVLFTLGPVTFGLDGGNWLLEMVLNASGSNLFYAINGMTPGAATQVGLSGTLSSAVPGNVTRVYAAPLGGVNQVTMGHFAVQAHYDATQLNAFSQPLNAWQGEAAGNRFARLAGESGYAARILGAPATSQPMGAQAIDTLFNLLQACEKADGGQVFEPRQQLALGYRTLASMYNQSPAVSADYSRAQLGGAGGSSSGDSGLDPVYDDLLTRNDWTLTRSAGSGASGSTFRAQLDDGSAMSISPPGEGGAGDYGDSETVNVQTDDQLQDLAWWKVHVGTVDQARWPLIPWNLARDAVLNAGLYYPLLDADIGDFAQIMNLPDVVLYDPVKQLVYGTKESLGGFHHAMEWNCVPELPYEVAADGLGFHVDTAGSSLALPAGSGDTALTVVTGAPPAWTQAPADFPFDAGIGGERVTVTSVAQAAKPLCRVGAYLNDGAYGASDFTGAYAAWQALGGPVIGVSRAYYGPSSFGVPLRTDVQEMITAGIKICIDLQPGFSPLSSTDLANMTTFLQALKTAGAEADISLWHEPFFSGLTASQYQQVIAYYGPAVRRYYPLVLCLSGGNDTDPANGYYPPASAYDKIAVDAYAGSATTQVTNAEAQARAAGKPFGIWEYNGATDAVNGQSQAAVTSFFSFLQSLMTSRLAAGLPNADMILFSSGNVNWLGTGLTQAVGFEGGIANWQNHSNSAPAPDTTTAHSGAGSMKMTSNAAGNMIARMCNVTLSSLQANARPVTAGQIVAANAWFKAAATPRGCQVVITVFDATATQLSSSAGTPVTDSTTGWTQVFNSVTAPANAAWAIAETEVTSTAAAGEAHNVDDVYLGIIPASNDLTQALQFSWDYRFGLLSSMQSALNNTSYPQAFTVTRAVNGVVKPQAAGTAVAPWQTPVAAL